MRGDITDAIGRQRGQLRGRHRFNARKEMAMSQTTTKRELALRLNDGIHVSLFWNTIGDVLTLEVYDERCDELYECSVASNRALDAFRHPFAYISAPVSSVQPCAA
jgi:hypothetical protein